jgi:predicted transcriptional regulator
MLKRYLAARYGMTPEDYRHRWGLTKDYPMVAPSYAAQRSALAKQVGLGRKPAAEEPAAPEPVPAAKEPRRRAAGRGKAAV